MKIKAIATAYYLITLFLVTPVSFAQEIVVTPQGKKIILYDDGTYKRLDNSQRNNSALLDKIHKLAKKHNASEKELNIVNALAIQGWTYTLPKPKSAQASWGNSDGRTTWWYGYWHNTLTDRYSQSMPKKSKSGHYVGDNQNMKGYYRRGGSPRYPNNIEKILSDI